MAVCGMPRPSPVGSMTNLIHYVELSFHQKLEGPVGPSEDARKRLSAASGSVNFSSTVNI